MSRRSYTDAVLRRISIALLLLLSLASCGNDERTRNEAMLFLGRFEQIDVDDPIEERRTAIEEIRRIALSTEDVVRARDACVDAHAALIEAEDESAAARQQFVVARRAGDDLPADIEEQIENAIRASEEAIDRSHELFPRCTREVNALETRFRRHHS